MGRRPEGKAEKVFKRLGKKLDEIISELNVAKGQADDEFKERFEEIKRNKETLKHEFKDFREKHKHKWTEIEESLEKAGDELKKATKEFGNAFETAFSKKKKN